MQIDTTAAFITALISSVVGFGLAFYIERKLSGGVRKKSQKILTFIAMTSFGYGLTAALNEVIGFPLQGLQIRYDKLAIFVVLNILFLPIFLLAIVKLIGSKNEFANADLDVNSNSGIMNYLRYILFFIGGFFILYLGYIAIENNASASDATYDFYTNVEYKNCNSPFEDKPYVSMKFQLKKETNEIFILAELVENGVKKQKIQKLDNCSVLNSKNWTCGGEWIGAHLTPKHSFVNGNYVHDKGISVLGERCDVKIVKR